MHTTKLQRSHSNNAASDGGGGGGGTSACGDTNGANELSEGEAREAELFAAAAAEQAASDQQAAARAAEKAAEAEALTLRWEGALDDPTAEAARIRQYKAERRNRYKLEYARVHGEEAAAAAAAASAGS